VVVVVKKTNDSTTFHASFKSNTQAVIYCETINKFMILLGEKAVYKVVAKD